MKYVLLLSFVFNLLFLFNSIQCQTPEDTYKAAVVEFQDLDYDSIYDSVDSVLEHYVALIAKANNSKAQIIVFPEYTLNGLSPITVPEDTEKAQPRTSPGNYSNILYELSMAAYDNNIYVLVNLVEKKLQEETDVTSRAKYYHYNTNVVFDNNGTIISKYRKINLFDEPENTPSPDKKIATFETDFGVTFGHFICFDLLFQKPAVEILNNVSNIAFPTLWYSELPFLTAVEIQESYAFTHNVNLLAAGANQPNQGTTGSGIYSGKRGMLTATMHGIGSTKLLFAELPKNPKSDIVTLKTDGKKTTRSKFGNSLEEMDKLVLKQENLLYFKSVILSKSGEYSLEYNNVFCRVNITFLPMENIKEPTYMYRLIAFDGVRSYLFATGGVADCAVIACTNEKLDSCATRFTNHSEVYEKNTISFIELYAVVPEPKWNETASAIDSVYHPVTLDTSIMPLPVSDYIYKTATGDKNKTEIFMEIIQLEDNDYVLLTFGITGRIFARDGQPVTGGTNAILSNIFVIAITLILSVFNLYME